MQHWNSRKALLNLTAILVMILSLALMGCGDDGGGGGDNLTPEDLAGKTFILPASFFNPLLTGNATVTYAADNFIVGDTIPFTVTFEDAPNTLITGTATVNSIEFEITNIEVDGVEVQEITIGEPPDTVTFAVGDTITIDTEVQTNPDGSIEITWINEDGDVIVFVFEEGQNTDTGTGGTGGTD
jgi:hypothetical protein